MNGTTGNEAAATSADIQKSPSLGRNVALGVSALAAFPGLLYGYVFGEELGGPLLGVLLGLNGALFCTLMVSSAIDWSVRRLTRSR